MSYFLFIDESGQDRRESPYEVLAGVSVRDEHLWNLINALHEAEIRSFGRRYSHGSSELKGKKFLNKKVFSHSQLNVLVKNEDIPALAKVALDSGGTARVEHLKALALAKIKYVSEVFDICARFKCRAFASIVEKDAEDTALAGLRKDYSYLFERFYYFLEDQIPQEQGIVVFDELEKSRSHILIQQMHEYFKVGAKGRARSRLIIPEPFFVHSELTTGIQLADLVAYVISWGFRTPNMLEPARDELKSLSEQVAELRYRAVRDFNGNPNFTIWSFAHIDDLRTQQERVS